MNPYIKGLTILFTSSVNIYPFSYNQRMHTQTVSFVFTLLLATHFAEGIFFPTAAVVPGATAVAGATAIGTTIAPNLLGIAGAAVGAKLLGLGALALANRGGGGRRRRTRGRGRREVDTEEVDEVQEEMDSTPYIKIIHELEPEECMRKMICSLAASNQKDNPILFAFGNNLDKLSVDKDAFKIGFDYKTAAKIGSLVKDIRKCEIRYKCSIDTDQLLDIANL